MDEDEILDLAIGDAAAPEDGALAHVLTAEAEDAGTRADRFLAGRLPDLSRTRLQRLVADGKVSVDGKVVGDAAQRVNAGEAWTVLVPAPEPAEPVPEAMDLAIVFEDDHLIVVDKPAGLVVHPAPGHWSGTLVNGLLHHCGATLSGIGGVRRPGIVHRLDKDTSGVLVVAKSDASHKGLADQFADHGRTGPLERAYLAFVWGAPALRGTVNAPIDRHPSHRQKMAVRQSGREAITHWTIVETFLTAAGEPVASLVECQLETGRTHQIRVHMAHIGHPLLGDEVYGQGFRTKASLISDSGRAMLLDLNRQALHAARLGFSHPVTGATLSFESPLPIELERLRIALAGA